MTKRDLYMYDEEDLSLHKFTAHERMVIESWFTSNRQRKIGRRVVVKVKGKNNRKYIYKTRLVLFEGKLYTYNYAVSTTAEKAQKRRRGIIPVIPIPANMDGTTVEINAFTQVGVGFMSKRTWKFID